MAKALSVCSPSPNKTKKCEMTLERKKIKTDKANPLSVSISRWNSYSVIEAIGLYIDINCWISQLCPTGSLPLPDGSPLKMGWVAQGGRLVWMPIGMLSSFMERWSLPGCD